MLSLQYVYWLMHHKSPYTVPHPAAWMSLFLHMYLKSSAQLYSLYFILFFLVYV